MSFLFDPLNLNPRSVPASNRRLDTMLKSTRKKKKLIISLPDDIVINDILTRLPVKTLMRFKLVSKQWYSTIQEDHNFSELHLSRSTPSSTKFLISFKCEDRDQSLPNRKVPLQHVLAVDHNGESASFVGLPLCKIKSCLDGLVVYYTCFAGGTAYVCNLSTKQTITLPPYHTPGEPIVTKRSMSDTVTDYFEIGYDRLTKMYKVLYFYYVNLHADDDETVESYLKCFRKFSIITIGKDDCWRKMSDRPPYPMNHRIYGSSKSYSNGAIHWMNVTPEPHDDVAIVAFDFTTEKFRVIPLPDYITGDKYMTAYTLRFLREMAGGHLAFYDAQHRRKNTVLIWLMEDYVNQVWTNKTFEYPFDCDFGDPIGTLPSGEIIMKSTRDTRQCWLYYYDLAKNTSRRVEFTSLPSQEYCRGDRSGRRVNIYHFVENLYSWKI